MLCARRESHIVIRIFSKELHELVGILSDYLRELWVASCNGLEDWLEHGRLLLDDLSQLLELWVVAQEVEVSGSGLSTSLTTTLATKCCSQITCTTVATCRSILTSLCGSLEQIDRLIARGRSSLCTCVTCLRRLLLSLICCRSLRCRWRLSLFTLCALGYAIQQVLHCPVWVEEGSAHRSVDLGAWEAHAFHTSDRSRTLLAESKR